MSAGGFVFIVFKTFVPQYEAVATLEFKESPGYIAFDHGGGASGPYFQTQAELIRSPWTIDRVLDNEKIKQLPEIQEQKDPGEWLTKRVLVGRRGLSDLMDIRYSSSDRDHVALVVNEVTRQYLDRKSEEEAKNRERLQEALAGQETIWKKAVTDLKGQVEAATEQVSGKEPDLAQPDPNSPAHNPLSDLQTRLIGLQVEHVMLTAKIRAGEEDLRQAKAADATQGKTKIAEDAPLSKDETKLRDDMLRRALAYGPESRQLSAQKRARLRSLETTLKQGKNNPMYITAEKEYATKEHNLEDSIRDEVEATLRAKRNESGVTTVSMRQEELDHLKKEEHGYNLAEENLKAAYGEKLKSFLTEFQKLSGERLNLTFMKDELGQKQSVLDRITQRLIEMQTEQAAPSPVEWRIEARTPEAPIVAIPFKQMELFGIAAFCLPFAMAVAWEAIVRRISGSDELEQHLHLAVLGEISRLPTRHRAPHGTHDAVVGLELRVFQESIDSLRTALTLHDSDDLRDMRVLAITSAVNHEGKTSVATQLALSLARATGKKTLLIDGDMRSPDVHKVFGISMTPGLAEVLSEECTLDDAIVTTHNAHVHLLPAGRLNTNPHRLLGNGAWKSLVDKVPDSYGYVIIDTPPVLAASEALVLAKGADATLLCVMRDVSRADQVRKAAERLVAAGGRPVGTVLSGIPTRRYTYGYGTYPAPHKPS